MLLLAHVIRDRAPLRRIVDQRPAQPAAGAAFEPIAHGVASQAPRSSARAGDRAAFRRLDARSHESTSTVSPSRRQFGALAWAAGAPSARSCPCAFSEPRSAASTSIPSASLQALPCVRTERRERREAQRRLRVSGLQRVEQQGGRIVRQTRRAVAHEQALAQAQRSRRGRHAASHGRARRRHRRAAPPRRARRPALAHSSWSRYRDSVLETAVIVRGPAERACLKHTVQNGAKRRGA